MPAAARGSVWQVTGPVTHPVQLQLAPRVLQATFPLFEGQPRVQLARVALTQHPLAFQSAVAVSHLQTSHVVWADTHMDVVGPRLETVPHAITPRHNISPHA